VCSSPARVSRSLEDDAARTELAQLESRQTSCTFGMATIDTILRVVNIPVGEASWGEAGSLPDSLYLGHSLAEVVASGFPIFGALAWFLDVARESEEAAGASRMEVEEEELDEACANAASREFRTLLEHHLREDGSVPTFYALQYLSAQGPERACTSGRAAAFLVLALTRVGESSHGGDDEESLALLRSAEDLLRQKEPPSVPSVSSLWQHLLQRHRPWPLLDVLHMITRRSTRAALRPKAPGSCLLIIYAFPTDEIKRDTQEFLQILERYFYAPLGVSHPLVVFTDEATAATLARELQPSISAPVVPAVIPQEELSRHMPSYSCLDGIDCSSGAAPASAAHRGVVNKTQFWSPDYLRISRYTAGPLFLHPALDACGAFIKLDTDFYLTAPLTSDPLEELRREGTRLAYWQIHVQGQRQAGYTEAALSFLHKRGMKILNIAFYARGRFEEKAEKLGIPLSEVPEALEAATVIYGCLFGGDIRFFREPLYQDFFRYMDALQGFEQAGWSNQFFLGTAAAAFLYPSQVRRLYISGRHQESKIDVANGNVTEYLTGSSKSIMR